MNYLFKSFAVTILTVLMGIGGIYFGIGSVDVFAAADILPTICIGNNASMTRDEFDAWRKQSGIRYIDIDGQILPPRIFFDGNTGKVYKYGELKDEILSVYLVPGEVSYGVKPPVIEIPAITVPVTVTPVTRNTKPIIFDDPGSILFSDDELSAMIEAAQNAGPLDAISAITLPNRKVTESELETWIAEYNEMGGVTAFELGVIREVNRVRVQHELRPLALSPVLMMSSRLKSQEFADLQYYNHRSPVHGSVTEAAQMFGFGGAVGEAMTRAGSNGEPVLRSTSDGVVAGMMASNKGHRELLLSPNLYSVGFGVSFSPNSRGANGNMTHMFYLVTQFGYSLD